MRLKVGVFLNAVADPSKVTFDRRSGKINIIDAPLIMNPPNRSAIQVALNTNLETYAFAIGKQKAEPVLREALALGIGNVCLIESDSFINDISYASLLARAFSDIGIDALFFGDTTIDYGHTGIAEATATKLGVSFIGNISSAEINNGKCIVTKIHRGKSFKIEVPIPCISTASHQETKRYHKPADIRDAYQKEIRKIRFETEQKTGLTIRKFTQVETKKPEPVILKGDPKQIVVDAMKLMKRMM